MKHLSKHLNFANVVSCIALFAALSGAAYAVTTPLGKKAVKTQNLANGAVTALKLHGGAVTTLKLKNGAVTGPKIGPAAVGTSAIASGAVRSEQLGGGVVTSGKVKNGAITGEKLAGSAVGTNQLSANAISTGKIQDGAVSPAKLSSSVLTNVVRNIAYASKASLSNSSETAKAVTADCPTGKQAIAGGARIVGAGVTAVAVTESVPAVSGEKRTGWTAAARVIGTETEANAWAVEAFAVCAEI
jgi:trimeric autotransporter adhesin